MKCSKKLFATWAPIASIALLHILVQSWVISTRGSPARDGGRYMTYALRLECEPWKDVVRSSEDHPGYPVFLHTAFSAAKALGVDSPQARVLLAQVSTAALGLIFVLLAFHVARGLWGLLPAWAGTAALVLLPRPAWQMSDILSESPYAGPWMASVALLLAGLRSGWDRRWLFLAAGAAASLAYWVRVDALTLPTAALVFFPAFAAFQARHREAPRKRIFSSAAAYSLGFGGGLALFVLVRGELSGKPVVDTLLGAIGSSSGRLPCLAGAVLPPEGGGLLRAIGHVFSDLGQELQYIHLATGAAGLLALRRLRRPRAEEAFLLALGLVYLGTLTFLDWKAGHLSSRYFLVLSPLITCLGMYGVLEAAKHVLERRCLASVRLPAAALLLAVLASLACSLPSLLKPRGDDRGAGARPAVEWVRREMSPGDTLHDPYFFPSYLEGLWGRTTRAAAPPPGKGHHYVIVQERHSGRVPELPRLIQEGRASVAAEFPGAPGIPASGVKVYRLAQADSSQMRP
jgi:hypothetical protein